MDDIIFGKLSFDIGWKKKEEIKVFGKKYVVKLDVAAYFETDEITEAQKEAYKSFKDNMAKLIDEVENKMKEMDSNSDARYVPALIKIKRDGGLAIAFDDVNDSEGGIVACILPELELMDPDQYF